MEAEGWQGTASSWMAAHDLSVSREVPDYLLGGAAVVLLTQAPYSMDFEAFPTFKEISVTWKIFLFSRVPIPDGELSTAAPPRLPCPFPVLADSG